MSALTDVDSGKARQKAMDHLARREYGRRELEQKLIAAGFEAETVTATVEKLTGEGLQDDRRYVDNFTRSRINQGKGPVRIRQELGERGLSSGLIEDGLEQVAAGWIELACQVRVKKFGTDLPQEFKEKARQMRFLQYRGFEPGQIQAAFLSHGDD